MSTAEHPTYKFSCRSGPMVLTVELDVVRLGRIDLDALECLWQVIRRDVRLHVPRIEMGAELKRRKRQRKELA